MLHKCSAGCIWKGLQPVNDFQGSRPLPLLPFDRPYTISYESFIVGISVSCTVFEILTHICQKWRRHVTLTMPIWGTVCHRITDIRSTGQKSHRTKRPWDKRCTGQQDHRSRTKGPVEWILGQQDQLCETNSMFVYTPLIVSADRLFCNLCLLPTCVAHRFLK